MNIKRTHFVIADNGHTGTLHHVQLDQVLPAHTAFHDTLHMQDGSRYQVVGLRSPPSDYVTLRRLDTALTPDQIQPDPWAFKPIQPRTTEDPTATSRA